MDARELRLREIAGMIGGDAKRTLEAERDALIRALAAEDRSHGRLAELARLSGLTRGRVHQIVTTNEQKP